MTEAVSDATLLRRAGAGDADAFESFMRRHRDSAWRYLITLLQEPADAGDAIQESFLAAWRGAAGFQGDDGARAWLLTIARHVAGRLRQRHAGEPEQFESLDALAGFAGWGDGDAPDLRVERLDDAARLQRVLATLGADDREIIVLRDLEGLEGETVATLLGITVPAMKSRLHRARLRLVAAVRREVTNGPAES